MPNPEERRLAPTADQIRHAIDSGRSGEKVDVVDPAAAPLGTDEEAAGTPPTAAERAMTAATELHPSPPEPGLTLNRKSSKGGVWVGVALGALAAVVVVVIMLAMGR